jgi:AraC-like DNA-binding protein
MDWQGEYLFGATGAAFRGSAADNAPHRHATVQLVSGRGDIVTVERPGNAPVSGPALLVRPGVPHTLHPAHRVTLVFLEPQSGAARELLAAAEPGPVVPLPAAIASLLGSDATLAAILAGIERPAATDLDPRLQVALDFLGASEGPRAIARAAEAAGLSTARLRALAQAQLDVPLTAWLAWHRLAQAGAALATGATLAEAAVDAGFADQAHLSRAYRKVFGITPRTAQDVVRAQQAKGSRP